MTEALDLPLGEFTDRSFYDDATHGYFKLRGIDPMSTAVSDILQEESWIGLQKNLLVSDIYPESCFSTFFNYHENQKRQASRFKSKDDNNDWVIENFEFIFNSKSEEMLLSVDAFPVRLIKKRIQEVNKSVVVPYSIWQVEEALKWTGREIYFE